MGVFADSKKARAAGGPRLHHDEGDFQEVVHKVETSRTRKPNERDLFAVETKVLEVERSEEMINKGVRKGSIVSWATLSDKEMFHANIKAFALALLDEGDNEEGFDEQVTDLAYEAYLYAITGKHQLAAGIRINVVARLSPTENTPDFIAVKWQGVPYEEQSEAGQVALAQIAKILKGDYKLVTDDEGERDDKKTVKGILEKIDAILGED